MLIIEATMSISNVPPWPISCRDQGVYLLEILLTILSVMLAKIQVVELQIQRMFIPNQNLMGLLTKESNLCSLTRSPPLWMKALARMKDCWTIVGLFLATVCLVLLLLSPQWKREDQGALVHQGRLKRLPQNFPLNGRKDMLMLLWVSIDNVYIAWDMIIWFPVFCF